MRTIKQTQSDRIFDILNHALLTVVLIVILYPLLYVLSASVSNTMDVLQGNVRLLPVNFTWESYRMVFRNEDILMGYKNTVVYTLVGTAVNIAMTIAGAYPLSRKDLWGRSAIMLFFTFTMFFSGGLIPSFILMKKLGLYNNFWIMILPGAVGMWNLIIVKTFFQNSIPNELQEAAFMDGCSHMGILLRVILPLSVPILAVMTIFYGVGHWNAYFTALIYFKDRSKFPLQLILREILIQDDVRGMMENESSVKQYLNAEGLKYSVIVVSSLPVLLLYPFLQKYFVKGVMVGAIKG